MKNKHANRNDSSSSELASHHENAAFHHESAAHHHRRAGEHAAAGRYDEANRHRNAATQHSEAASLHGNRSDRLHQNLIEGYRDAANPGWGVGSDSDERHTNHRSALSSASRGEDDRKSLTGSDRDDQNRYTNEGGSVLSGQSGVDRDDEGRFKVDEERQRQGRAHN